MKVSPTIKLLLMEVVGCFYLLMLFKPLATGVNDGGLPSSLSFRTAYALAM